MTQIFVGRGLPAQQRRLPVAVLAATACSLEAALIHLWYLQESFMEWWGYGIFFAACAAGQTAYVPLLLKVRTQAILLAGIWANAAVMALYVVTRVWGIPLGPHKEAVEPVGIFDFTSVACEAVLVLLLVPQLEGTGRKVTVNGLMLLGLGLWALRLAVGAVLP